MTLSFTPETKKDVKYISLYTDGGSRNSRTKKLHHVGKNDKSAYAYFLKYGGLEKIYGEATWGKTNNAMELMAVIRGLQAVKNKNIPIMVYSDSKYIVNCIHSEWYKSWEKKGWNIENGLKNKHLWIQLVKEIRSFTFISFTWVKGHQSNKYNNMVDLYCNELMDNQ